MKKLITLLLFLLPLWANAQTEGEIRKAMDAYDYETPIARITPVAGDSVLTPLRAQALKAMNRHAEALKEWNSLLKEDSTNTKALIELAECYQFFHGLFFIFLCDNRDYSIFCLIAILGYCGFILHNGDGLNCLRRYL